MWDVLEKKALVWDVLERKALKQYSLDILQSGCGATPGKHLRNARRRELESVKYFIRFSCHIQEEDEKEPFTKIN